MAPSIVATALLVAAIVLVIGSLVTIVAFSVVIQRRRYLRTREHLGGRLLRAQDDERARLARDLHDDIVQRLVGIRELYTRPTGTPAAAAALDRVTDDLRQLARGLHPPAVAELSMPDLLESLATMYASETIAVTCNGLPDPAELPAAAKLALFRVAQEALGNALRYSGTDAVSIEFSHGHAAATLTIRDAGRGFDLATQRATTKLGIVSMRERMELLGGMLEIDSAPGRGTLVRATMPAARQ